MPESIEPRILEKLRVLSGEISSTCYLDPDIQAELYTHLEDKLLGYLSGTEKITGDDAFILVREHFGSPGNLKRLLRKVHAPRRCIAWAGRFTGLPIARP